jgi:hypothetical protein
MSKKEKLKKKKKSPFEPTGEVPVVLYSSTIPRTIVDRTSPVAGALKLAGFFNAIAWLILIFGTIGAGLAGWNNSHAYINGKWYALHDARSHFLESFFWTFVAVCVLAALFAFFGYSLRLLCELITKRVVH